MQGPPHGLKGLMVVGTPWWHWLVAALILLALLALAYLLYKKYRARPQQKNEPVVEQAPPIDPLAELARALRALQLPLPFEGKNQEEFYFQLSFLLRRALEWKTSIPMTDLTYRELEPHVRKKLPFDLPEVEQLLGLLRTADMIKFAENRKTREQAEDDKEQVRQWIKRLIPELSRYHPGGDLSDT